MCLTSTGTSCGAARGWFRWGGGVISDPTLTSRINAARKAAGDSSDEQRLIRTVVRKGACFGGAVEESAQAACQCATT
jgi:DNA-binding winged helix-turn-helix (wHTH) protein